MGKRDFNPRMQRKLSAFLDRLKSGDYRFTNLDFKEIPAGGVFKGHFLHVDPPYLITCATYNEQNGWTGRTADLLAYLDRVDGCGMRFALSNVVRAGERKMRFRGVGGTPYGALPHDPAGLPATQIPTITSRDRDGATRRCVGGQLRRLKWRIFHLRGYLLCRGHHQLPTDKFNLNIERQLGDDEPLPGAAGEPGVLLEQQQRAPGRLL